MDKLKLSDKFVKYKDMWSCMSDEQCDKVGGSNFWLNEDDVKLAINDTIKDLDLDYFVKDKILREHILNSIKQNFGGLTND